LLHLAANRIAPRASGSVRLAPVTHRLATTLALAMLLLGAGGAGAHAVTFTWSPLQWVDTASPFGDPNDIVAMSCPTTTFCAALDDTGNVLTATDPAGGRSAWAIAPIEPAAAIPPETEAMSCPTVSFCAAVDAAGNVYTSSAPAAGSSDWAMATIDRGGGPDAISCPTSSMCVVVDQRGSILASADPSGGAGAWRAVDADASRDLDAVDCPSTTLCVAGDESGDVVTSRDPGAADPTWTRANVDGTDYLLSVSCPSVSLCVAGGNGPGTMMSSTDPAAGAGAWHRFEVDGEADWFAVSCPNVSLCVASSDAGTVATSDTPGAGDAGAWTVRNVGFGLNDLACPTSSLCVGGSLGGWIAASGDPAGGLPAWSKTQVDGTTSVLDSSCPSVSLCVIGDDAGRVLRSSDPGASPSRWVSAGAPSPFGSDTGAVYGLTCMSRKLCLALITSGEAPGTPGFGGGALYAFTPVAGRRSWRRITLNDVGSGIDDVGCNATLCAIIGDSGPNPQISTHPRSSASWHLARGAAFDNALAAGASCPTASLCVSLGERTGALAIMTVHHGRTRARELTVDRGHSLGNVSCPSASLCVAADNEGYMVAGDPAGPASGWSRELATPDDSVNTLSCVGHLCLGGDWLGRVVVGVAAGRSGSV